MEALDYLIMSGPGRTTIEQSNTSNCIVKVTWNEEFCFFGLKWTDDIWDTKVTKYENRRWNHPIAKRGKDKMYFNDNLAIRLFIDDDFYEIWFQPDVNEAYQWDIIGIKDKSKQPYLNSSTYVLSRKNKNEVNLEVGIPWEIFNKPLEEIVKEDIQIVVIDNDLPSASLIEKEKYMKYLYRRISFIRDQK